MKAILFNLLISISFTTCVFGQDKGNINIHYGTIIVYQTYSLGYETFDLLKNSEKHQLRPLIRFGGWKANLTEPNNGLQASIGLSYLLGSSNHHLEFTNEMVTHFDKSLKGQGLVYISSLYRPFLGYRYQSENSKFIGRVGFGWKEILQLGLGFRL